MLSEESRYGFCAVCGVHGLNHSYKAPFWFCPDCNKKFDVVNMTIREIPMYDPVTKPKHYNIHPSGVECIQITEHMNFCRGNAIKYIWRAGDKGNEIQDLEKAVWYLNKEIERLKKASCKDQSK